MDRKRKENCGISKTRKSISNNGGNDNKDFSSRKISFRIAKKNTLCFRAGNFGRKRVHLFSNNRENDKHFYDLYFVHTHPRITHSNKLTCFIKENERIIYTGKNFR